MLENIPTWWQRPLIAVVCLLLGAHVVLDAQSEVGLRLQIMRYPILVQAEYLGELATGINSPSSSIASFGDGFNAFAGVAASPDGLRVFISSKKSKNITIADLETGVSSVLACDCLPTGFRPLKGTSVFRLSDPADGPVAVLDGSSAEPGIIILPVASAVIAPTPEEVQQQ